MLAYLQKFLCISVATSAVGCPVQGGSCLALVVAPKPPRPADLRSTSLPPPPAGTAQNARPLVRSHHHAQASQSSSTTRPAQGGISEPTSSGQAIGPEQRWGGTCWSTLVRGAQCAEVRAPGCLRREAQGAEFGARAFVRGEKGCAFALGPQRGRGTQDRAGHGRANRLAHAHRTLLIASLCAPCFALRVVPRACVPTAPEGPQVHRAVHLISPALPSVAVAFAVALRLSRLAQLSLFCSSIFLTPPRPWRHAAAAAALAAACGCRCWFLLPHRTVDLPHRT